MSRSKQYQLMAKNEGPAAELINPAGKSPVILVCEHASNFIPAALNNLGLEDEQLSSHVVWDPGALNVAKSMSKLLDARLVASRVSRLVYDCNRPPHSASATPGMSETTLVPGNLDLDDNEVSSRVDEVYAPFRRLLTETVNRAMADARQKVSPPPVIVTVHSFTPVYFGKTRTAEVGLLSDTDKRLAKSMLSLAPRYCRHRVEPDVPYSASDGMTHTLKQHAVPNKLLNVMIEIRNDLIANSQDAAAMAANLSELIEAVLAKSPVMKSFFSSGTKRMRA